MISDANPRSSVSHRQAAGRALALKLQAYAGRDDVIVLALPRGGVVVGIEVAAVLHAPLAVLLVRRLAVPGHEELALGAVTSGGLRYINHAVTEPLHITEEAIETAIHQGTRDLLGLECLYARGIGLPDLRDKIVVLTDDRLATGSSMLLACYAVRNAGARELIVAVPVSSRRASTPLFEVASQVITLAERKQFEEAEDWREDFDQPSDLDASRLLKEFLEQQKTRVVQTPSPVLV